MKELKTTDQTRGLPMDVVCSILTMEMQVKDARIKELESRLENNVIAEITVSGIRQDFYDDNKEELKIRPDIYIRIDDIPDALIQQAISYVVEVARDTYYEGETWVSWDDDLELELHHTSIYEVISCELTKGVQRAVDDGELKAKV